MTEHKVLNILSKSPMDFLSLAKKLSVPRNQNKDFSKFLFHLESLGKIASARNGKFFLVNPVRKVEGQYLSNKKGYGFVQVNGEKDDSIFIPRGSASNAINNDLVEAVEFNDPTVNKLQGKIISVKERQTDTFIGITLKIQGKVVVDFLGSSFYRKIRFERTSKIPREKCFVKVKIVKVLNNIILVNLIEEIGREADPRAIIEASIIEAGVKTKFDETVITELKNVPDEVKSVDSDRKDIRDLFTVTIDGDDSKDFDDAISVIKEDDKYRLFVHIADVSHYVKENDPIDKEALKRGTSIYLADRVIPMLPEKLSNGICSLNPNVDRNAITLEVLIDQNGDNADIKTYPSVIKSDHRLTYNNVNRFYKGDFNFNNQELEDMLSTAKELSSIIGTKKIEEGYINFEIDEPKIELNDDGSVKSIGIKPTGLSQKIIEDFMVRANETISELIEGKKLPFVFRIHEKPEYEKIEALQRTLLTLGMNIEVPMNSSPKVFSDAILKVREIRFDDFIKIMLLRTMSKAKYSPTNIGHYGLASKSYTHFTSPIRRYPDLMVHRMLREYIFNGKTELSDHFAKILDPISKQNSDSEVIAMTLERKVNDIKKAEYYEKFIGKEKEGTIVTILEFGFFVEFDDKVTGFVHFSTLPSSDRINPESLSVVHNGKLFKIGERINVIIDSVERLTGKISLRVINNEQTNSKK